MNYKNLTIWFEPVECLLHRFKTRLLDGNYRNRRRLFWDNSGKVLIVAHFDTIQPPRLVERTKHVIVGSGLDDRLGCWLAYELGHELGCDILLCDNEEAGASTAAYHEAKDYNWVVEFDRRGTDVVIYHPCKNLQDTLKQFWVIGLGAFSDISFLPTMAASFNLGVGYTHAHSLRDVALVADIEQQTEKFIRFYKKYKNARFVKDTITVRKGINYGFYWD